MLTKKMDDLLQKNVKKMKTLQFAMNLPSLGLRYRFSSTTPNQRFHSASVGKLMTATVIFAANEQGKLSLESRIHTILKPEILDRLFVFRGHDYKEEITVKQLLSHTSGVNDYFESKTMDGSLFIDDVIQHPDTMWMPMDLLDFTRNRQQAVAKPGEKFFYSDTGFILLGLIAEAAFDMPFHQVLKTLLFESAGMHDTDLCFYGDGFDPTALAPLFINNVDVHLFQSVSCDFSGGGLSTTAEDLLKFLDHLQNGAFISQQSIDIMSSFDHRFRQGLYYSTGMMQVRFEEFFFLLKGMPRLQGHIGVTGVHAWYHPETHDSFVLNVGNAKDMAMSFQLLITILQLINQENGKK
ncbi:MAG: serine hydrolase domain-containing protein [Eubacteriales bacterium]|jgi:D-alanyl-D-alanine carboxypeptidase|nr:serine hydrolase domain-containing protein [Eubacteriales bacterium]